MRKFTLSLAGACLFASASLVSCSTSHQAASPSLAYQSKHDPHFIDNITLKEDANKISLNIADNSKYSYNTNLNTHSYNILVQKYAGVLCVAPQAITNLSLYKFIDEWYGTAYRFGGSDKSGIDCSAFVQRLYNEVFGMNLVRTSMEQFNKCKVLWDKSELKEGSLVFFHTTSSHISHVGIYLMNGFFVHASSRGVMINSLNDNYWEKTFACGGDLPRNNSL